MTDWLERTVAALKAAPTASPGFEARVLRAAVQPARRSPPIGAILALAGSVAAAAVLWRRPGGVVPVPPAVDFSVEAPAASAVTLVGDFNDWDRSRTPLHRVDGSSRWTVRMPLPGGLYRYAFLVDGGEWRPDPVRPVQTDPEFGPPVSIVTVAP